MYLQSVTGSRLEVANIYFTLYYHQAKMVEIFTDLHATYKNIPSRMKAESFKQRVVSCFKAWEVS